MRVSLNIISIIGIVLLCSCERFIEVEIPNQEPRLVLNALLEQNDTLKVYLTKSRSVLEGREYDGFESVRNAIVSLRDESGQVFTFDPVDRSLPWMDNYVYELPNPGLLEGKSYEIIAEASGFNTVNSFQTLPESVKIKEVNFTDLGEDPNFTSQNIYEVSVKFDDLPGSNYYEISGNMLGKSFYVNEGDTMFYFYSSELYPNPVNQALKKDHMMRQVLLFQDVYLNGEDSEVTFRTRFPRDVDIEITINLSHVSEAYYRYYDTADLQRYNQGDILSQPVLVYNNIRQGIGIFKSRNTNQKTFNLRVEEN
ncbi:DUF4249 domain-containing protein [Mongoliibacter ruber]|uniref:Uncharacterized protein DUF4249 n=1 Tax=Mongoliibacter ruber TaxID=1750599 RepID=A0A2T0WIV8_9BACT|nr:DUF4249 domain-containing protein [Mongoliibacter ruber]PRY86627.1 uncharacterized protein DUF4249 [Mongoliibacter ruber]